MSKGKIIHDTKMQESAELALGAVSKILEWVELIGEEIYNTLSSSYNKKTPPELHYIFSLPPCYGFAIPSCYISLAAPPGYIWTGRGKKVRIPSSFYFVIIGLHIRTDRKWKLQVGWGDFKGVERKVGKFIPKIIAQELLDEVNAQRKDEGAIDIPHIKGDYCMQWHSFFKYDSREKVAELAQIITENFNNWLRKFHS